MTYEELVKNADAAVKKIDADSIKEHAAIEFDIEGEGEGAFYLELGEGKAVVEPYEYYDKDCRIRTTADVFKELIAGNLDLNTAVSSRGLRIEGNADKIAFFTELLKEAVAEKVEKSAKKPAAKKTAAKKAVKADSADSKEETEKKPAAKKTATKKATTKKAAEAEATETKSAEKKAPAKKTVAKKAAAKEESAADTTAEAKPKKTTKKATTKKA